MGGIETQRADVAKRPHMLAIDGGAERVAAVLDQEQAVTIAQRADRAHVERVAERVGDHDRLGARRDRRGDRRDIHIICRDVHVDEDRTRPPAGWD